MQAKLPFEISVRTQSGCKLVKLRGDVRRGAPVDKIDETLAELYAGERCIILDLEEVPMIDSSGIGALVRALTFSKRDSIVLKLIKPSKLVLQTLKLVRLLPLFNIYDDLDKAVESLESES